jgi:hypothetical protein
MNAADFSTSWLTVTMELGNYPTAGKPNISHYVLDSIDLIIGDIDY